MKPPSRSLLLLAGGALGLGWAMHGLGLSPAAAVSALIVLALAFLPPGLLLVRWLPRERLLRGERPALALLLGYPACAVLYWSLSVLGASRFYPLVALALATLAALAAWRDRGGGVTPVGWGGTGALPHWSLAVTAPLALHVAMRGAPAFAPLPGGAVRYEHSMDHSIHMAFYWELLRGAPPAQIPALAGVPFPRYHLLAFMPGLVLSDWAGLQVSTVYHLVSPALRLALLMVGVYLAVRLRSGDGRLASASIPALFFVDGFLAWLLDGRFLEGTTPLYFFVRSESGGGGVLVWITVGALTALFDNTSGAGEPRSARALYLAAILAGASCFFKAQVFVLLGSAYGLALALRALRERSRTYLRALALMGASLLLLSLSWRGPGDLGHLFWTPGAFAEQYVYPVLARDPLVPVREGVRSFFRDFPFGLGWVLATPLALWRVVEFSPFVPIFVGATLGRLQAVGLMDAALALSFPLTLPWACFVSTMGLDREVTPYEVLQATASLAILGAAVNVVVAAAVLRRWRLEAPRLVLWSVLSVSAGAMPLLLRAPPFVPPRAGIVLGLDEQCAMKFLREQTPFDSVVASDRTDALPEVRGSYGRFNHQAVVAGLAGRRSVLEYYGKDTDPEQNRQRTLRLLFATPDASEARRILQQLEVDYVLEYAGHPLSFPRQELPPAFARGDVRIYAVGTGTHRRPPFRPAAWLYLPALLREKSDLDCPG